MNRSTDVTFMAEYIKNKLFFATVRHGKTLKSSSETHYFCIDDELVYENYYSDFGPLNLGCVYKYCKVMNDKLKQCLNKQSIVHYTSIDPKKKANAAYLLGCYGVLCLSLHPRDALKPLTVHGQSYRPFQDATQGDSDFTISLMDCLQAISKAKNLGFFNLQDFNYEEYERLDKIQGGDLNWIVPGKFLAFIGPVDYSVSLYHPPQMYIKYFLQNNVKIVIRLNKRLYDGNVFNKSGINHYDLFFPDGTCPPRHILMKFLQIVEESKDAIAVHCKAGLGRTGSLIGCYLMKHYRMTSHEAIAWMRICRPGSVIGHQQAWLEQLEAWLMKQGNLYRKRVFNDTEKLPYHEFGVYSIAERTMQQRPVIFNKSPSPPQPISRQVQSDIVSPIRPQASRLREDKRHDEEEEEEVFLTSCDLTINHAIPMTQMKGCIIRKNMISEAYEESGSYLQKRDNTPLWKKILSCTKCLEILKDEIWAMSVRCARVAPKSRRTYRLCSCMDKAAPYKTKKEPFEQWRLRPDKISTLKTNQHKGRDRSESSNIASRRGSGAGEPRAPGTPLRCSDIQPQVQRTSAKSNESSNRNQTSGFNITTFRTTNGPMIKNVNDARNFLLKSSKYSEERERRLMSSVIVTPHAYSPNRTENYRDTNPPGHTNSPPHVMIPSAFSTASRGSTQPLQQRRRLGRSPSPVQGRMSTENTRATNTPPPLPKEKSKTTDSKTTLRDALSRLKFTSHRDGSIGAASVGAASLGARRDAPTPRRAPSVRSDERPIATQGDLLNSIKFQRRLRDTIQRTQSNSKEKPNIKALTSRTSAGPREAVVKDFSSREKPNPATKNSFGVTRPSSPKGRRSPHSSSTFH